MTDATAQIFTALVSAVAVVAGTWLGAYLNRKSTIQTATQLASLERYKYTQDRLWDAKKETYSVIISELNAMLKLTHRIYDGFFDGEMHPEEYFQCDSYNKDNRDLWDRRRALEVTFDSNTLILSDAFKAQYDEWLKDLFFYDENEIPPEQARSHREAMDKHVPLFVEVAKLEIDPKLPSEIY